MQTPPLLGRAFSSKRKYAGPRLVLLSKLNIFLNAGFIYCLQVYLQECFAAFILRMPDSDTVGQSGSTGRTSDSFIANLLIFSLPN